MLAEARAEIAVLRAERDAGSWNSSADSSTKIIPSGDDMLGDGVESGCESGCTTNGHDGREIPIPAYRTNANADANIASANVIPAPYPPTYTNSTWISFGDERGISTPNEVSSATPNTYTNTLRTYESTTSSQLPPLHEPTLPPPCYPSAPAPDPPIAHESQHNIPPSPTSTHNSRGCGRDGNPYPAPLQNPQSATSDSDPNIPSTTLCSQAFTIIQQNYLGDIDAETIKSWLCQGFRTQQIEDGTLKRVGEGCRVENSNLMTLLDMISR